MTKWIIKRLIVAGQRVPLFRARGSYSGLDRLGGSGNVRFAKCELEFNDHENLLANFKRLDIRKRISARTVLDYGSGYGGRTVWMAQYARRVEGVEIHQNMVDLSREYAAYKGASNVGFTKGSDREILFEDGHFDAIITFDVLEHVADPARIMREFRRVLKDGGIAVVIFTPYYGVFSHHLNYITLLPGLHWFFSPESLVEAINELIRRDPRFAQRGLGLQPAPKRSFNGRRRCLPTLNGLTKPEYLEIVRDSGFRMIRHRSTSILEKSRLAGRIGAAVGRTIASLPWIDELFSHNLVSILAK